MAPGRAIRSAVLIVAALAATIAVPAVAGAADPTFTQIDAGSTHTCGVLSDGGVACWGRNSSGQLGDGTTNGSDVPVRVSDLENVTSVSAGDNFSCAVLQIGDVRCWGSGDGGRLGNGSTRTSRLPVDVIGITTATSVSAGGGAAGGGHACAVLRGGVLKCWGRNDKGQLGDGTTTSRSTPVDVKRPGTATAVSAGGAHTCAIYAGKVRCWGGGLDGRLGNGATRDSSTPVAVSALSGVKALAAGAGHSCALLTAGTVSCWGSGTDGQLGPAASGRSSTPVQVTGITGATAVAAAGGQGGGHSCALLGSGAVSCWGYGAFGELGDGAGTDSADPVTATGVTSAVALTAGGGHTCVRLAAGSASCWGLGTTGQLGGGGTSDSNVPLAVTAVAAIPPPPPSGVESGTVLVKLAGSNTFVALRPGDPLPPGSEIDARKGRVRITPPGQKNDSAVFYGGIFIYRQIRERGRLITELTLSQPLDCPTAGRAGASAKDPKRRKLWGDGKGSFKTRGKNATAGVRGTRWLTSDTCTSTLIRVARGTVTVRDLIKKRTIILRAPRSYTTRTRTTP